ncbi:MAG: tRNA/rRNA methyltransferase [Bacteroidales bacterium]
MISRAQIKYIRSLELKKFRDLHNAFVAEGNKAVAGMMGVFECEWILAKSSWMATQGYIPATEWHVDEDGDIRKVSFLKNPQDVIAVFKRPAYDISEADASSQLVIALDGIQDPGNLGTIVRLAGWFGIEHIVCSPDTADVFAPKAVQATMGALAHVKVHYAGLSDYLAPESERSVPVYGAFPEGESLYARPLTESGVIVLGNEGKGIRSETESLVSRQLHIPGYPPGGVRAESLNVAVAAAIVCAEFRRQTAARVSE